MEVEADGRAGLGFGAMRLPVVNGNDAQIDVAAAEEMVAYAMEHGINYYDTAWGYHNGNSENVIGKALSRYPREKYYLATKFPGYDLSNMPKVQEIFEKQLEKCGVEYFDFYLFHNVCEMNINEYLDEQYGIYTYLMEQKKNGRIRHLGFSAHGSCEVIKRFLEAYGDDMEFCQIQLNYVDWTFQHAEEKVRLLDSWHIPIWVMEPMRGGRLAKLPEESANKLKTLRPEEEKTLNQEETKALAEVAANLQNNMLPCTACHYCVSHCPKGLDIPMLLELYNEHSFTGGGFIAPMALMAVPEEKHPSACVGCRSCEKVCPQQIKISEAMSSFAKMLK